MMVLRRVQTITLDSPIPSPDTNEQTSRHTYRLLMTTSEAVIIGWLQVPPKAVLSRWPKHEVSGQLSGEGICRFAVPLEMSPLRPHTEHEFGLAGEGPGLLEEKIRVPFRRVTSVEGRHPRLQFKPVLDWGTLCRKVGRKRRSTPAEVPVSGCSDLQDGDRIVLVRGGFGWVHRSFILSRLPKGR